MTKIDFSSIAPSLAAAKVGDTVLLRDGNANAYDDNGKYIGRGRWTVAKIDGETRVSFLIGTEKFDRVAGSVRATNGYTPMRKIAGIAEYEASQWMAARHNISRIVDGCDYETLRKVAAVFGIKSVGELP
jgi:hypothetical protein